jgi:hypothetical protein
MECISPHIYQSTDKIERIINLLQHIIPKSYNNFKNPFNAFFMLILILIVNVDSALIFSVICCEVIKEAVLNELCISMIFDYIYTKEHRPFIPSSLHV